MPHVTACLCCCSVEHVINSETEDIVKRVKEITGNVTLQHRNCGTQTQHLGGIAFAVLMPARSTTVAMAATCAVHSQGRLVLCLSSLTSLSYVLCLPVLEGAKSCTTSTCQQC